jgi:hypothetical protein
MIIDTTQIFNRLEKAYQDCITPEGTVRPECKYRMKTILEDSIKVKEIEQMTEGIINAR